MEYPPHALLAFGGPLFNDETWSCGLRFSRGPGADVWAQGILGDVWWDDHLEDMAEDIRAWWVSQPISGSQAKLGWVKFNAIRADGRYADQGVTHRKDFTAPLPAPTGTSTMPPQVALTVSLTTALQRGRAHSGRIYLPIPRFSISGTGQITAQDALTAANSVAGLINSLNNVPGWDAATWSAGMRVSVLSGIPPGTEQYVTGVRCGMTFDTQRKRRRSLPESYSVATTAISG